MTLLKSNAGLYKDFVPTTFSELVENFFKETAEAKPVSSSVLTFVPKVDISETEKQFEISLQVAGIYKEDIKIDFQDGKLTVSGERKFDKTETGKKFHKIETQYGSFHSSFVVPEHTNHEAIEAEFNNGILNIVIPKDEKKVIKATISIK